MSKLSPFKTSIRPLDSLAGLFLKVQLAVMLIRLPETQPITPTSKSAMFCIT